MDVSCIPESGCCCLFVPLVFIFSFSNIQTLKIIVTLFLGTVRPRRLKIGAQVDNRWMYCVYRNQAAAGYLSLYFFIFLSLQFGQWVVELCIPKVFITFFSRTARHKKLK